MNHAVFDKIHVLLGALSRRRYQRVVALYSPGIMLFNAIAFALIAAAVWSATLTFTVIYLNNRSLLEGAGAVGEVLDIDVKAHRPRRASDKTTYATTVTYAFTTRDGRRFTNVTRRTLAWPPLLHRGSPIPVLYDATSPAHSTMRAEFATEMSTRRAFAWMSFFVGFYPALYACRHIQWRRDRQREAAGAVGSPQVV
jgi:hypothetical protein